MLLHGFAQNRRCFAPLDRRLSEQYRVTAVDLPGHGESAAIQTDLVGAAQQIAAQIDRSIVVGYSLGGRVALHLALATPAKVERLVLIGAHPGLEDASAREARRASDRELADRIEREGLEAFLDDWLRGPLFSGLPPEARFLDQRRKNQPPAIAESLRRLGLGEQEPLCAKLGGLSMPVLLVVGGRDTKFAALAGRMREAIGARARLEQLPGAGHAAHLEAPEAFLEALHRWIGAPGA